MKLTPGRQKRGKASKQAIEVFSRGQSTPAPHKVLMKGVTDNEMVAAMIGDVKVSVAGLAQATQVRFLVVFALLCLGLNLFFFGVFFASLLLLCLPIVLFLLFVSLSFTLV